MRYNRSIWWKEIDTAIIDLIKTNLRYTESGIEKVVPTFITPILSNEYQLPQTVVLLSHLDAQEDTYRQDDDSPILLSHFEHTGNFEKPVKHYKMRYQVSIISNKHTIFNEIVKDWSLYLPKVGALRVKTADGVEKDITYTYSGSGLIDYIQEAETKYLRATYFLTLYNYLDEGIVTTNDIVTDVIITSRDGL